MTHDALRAGKEYSPIKIAVGRYRLPEAGRCGARAEMVKQCVGDLSVVRLSCGQAEPDRQALRVDDDMDLGREPSV